MTAARTPLAGRRFVLETVVFISAAIGMVLELAGSRLMAPYFGNSLFVWTSLIGVILAFMSVGNYVGGRLGDRWVDATMLSWVLGWGALGVAATSAIGTFLLGSLAGGGTSKLGAVLAACLLFAAPSALLGIVSPYSIRLRMSGMEHAGATVGRLYAIATVGSIAGTFTAGFWLISVMGTKPIILLCTGVLLAMSAALMGKLDWRQLVLFAAVIALAAASWVGFTRDSEVAEIDTQYDHYLLRTVEEGGTGRTLVGLSRDYISAESVSYADTGEPYPFEYYGYYDLAAKLTGGVDRALLIGGGTFSYPRIFLGANPDSSIDVVEIDGQLVQVATEHFGYRPDPRMNVYLEDGRTFLNRATGPYDAVFMDAFKSESTVPYQLTTVQTWQRCYDVLDEDGVLVMNVVASPSDERAEFFDALYASIASVFPQVKAYAVQTEAGEGELRNTSIIASKSAKTDLAATVAKVSPDRVAHELDYTVPKGTRVLTDDFAPVDQYLMGL